MTVLTSVPAPASGTVPPVVVAALAGAAVAVALGLLGSGRVRLTGVLPHGRRPLPRAVPPGLARHLAAGLAAAAGVLLDGPLLGVLSGAALELSLRARARSARDVARVRERERASQALGALAAELRSGRAPPDALDAAAHVAVGGTADLLRAAATAARLGADVPRALMAPASTTAVPDVVRALGTCWEVCASTGSGLATSVDRLATALRQRVALEQLLDAELAGPRASALLLAVLPAVGVLLAAGLGARPVHVLLHTPVGIACLVVGLALDGAGLLWSRRIAAAALR